MHFLVKICKKDIKNVGQSHKNKVREKQTSNNKICIKIEHLCLLIY